MGKEVPGKMIGFLPADADMYITANSQYTAVQVATAASGIVGSGIGNASVKPLGTGTFLGVLQNPCVLGEAASVMIDGVTKWQASGSFNVGDLLTADANGKCLKATTGQKVYGVALEQAVTGDITTVVLRVGGLA